MSPERLELGVEVVIKLGGRLLAFPRDLQAALDAITSMRLHRRVLVVPGGGPFADVVRSVDGTLGLGADAAHWMAVLAMDQYAHLIASRMSGAMIVETPHEISQVFVTGGVPVLAPSRWLRQADPLPHSWDVTSDSIAAWTAGAVGAARLIVIKAPGAVGALVDDYFCRALPATVTPFVVPADELHICLAAL